MNVSRAWHAYWSTRLSSSLQTGYRHVRLTFGCSTCRSYLYRYGSTQFESAVVTAIVCSALVLVDLFMFSTINRPVLAAVNLGTGVLAMWVMALAAITITKRSKQLADATQTLQKSIDQVEQSERAVAKTEERLRLAMSGAGMGTFDRDLRTNKTIWSDTHFRMLGYEPLPSGKAAVEMWSSLLHPNDRHRVLDAQELSRRNNSQFGAGIKSPRRRRESRLVVGIRTVDL